MKKVSKVFAVMFIVFGLGVGSGLAAEKAKKVQRKIANAAHDLSAERDLNCGGTEPFWNLDIKTKDGRDYDLNFSSPSGNPEHWGAFIRNPFAGMAEAFGGSFEGKKNKTKVVVVNDSKCSDGMSDNEYAYEVFVVSQAGSVLYGCCKVTKNNDLPGSEGKKTKED